MDADSSNTLSLQANMFTIPTELLIYILAQLDHISLLSCSLVCTRLSVLVKNVPKLQYIVQLAVDGLMDVPASNLSDLDRLLLLFQRRARLHTLEWTKQKTLTMSWSLNYDLAGDVFSTATRRTNAQTGKSEISSIRTCNLPTFSTEERFTDLHEVELENVQRFIVNEPLDLIVFIQQTSSAIHIHLRSLASSGAAAHVGCHEPVLCADLAGPECRLRAIHLIEDLIGMHIDTDDGVGGRVIVWNWRTGKKLRECHNQEESEHVTIHDFNFLSARSLMLLTEARRVSGSNIAIAIYDVDNLDAQPLVELNLPTFLPRSYWVLSKCRISTEAFVSGASADRPFTTSPDSQIYVIDIGIHISVYSTQQTLRVVVRRDCLLALLHEYTSRSRDERTSISWGEWGPTNSRAFDMVMARQNPCRQVYGGRVALTTITGLRGTISTQLVDFNIAPYKVSSELVTEPSTTSIAALKNPIVTSLPYHSVPIPKSEFYDEFMAAEDRLIGVKFLGSEIGPIDVFCL